jgi:hypothetical protein
MLSETNPISKNPTGMKHQSQAMIQFSGYPLRIAEPKQKPRTTTLVLVKPEVDQHTTAIQKNKISNDSNYWDESWFNGYE